MSSLNQRISYKMLVHTCDANVIFNNIIENKFTGYTLEYIKEVNNEKILLLNEVRHSFTFRLTRILEEISDVIISSVNITKEFLIKKKQRDKDLDSRLVKSIFKNHLIKNIEADENLSKNKVESLKFANILLEKYSFKELCDLDTLEKFREESSIISNNLANEKFNLFRKKFENEVHCPRFSNLDKANWEQKLRAIRDKEGFFKDDEDIFIASEYLAYVDKKNNETIFSSFDREFINSMNASRKDINIEYPQVINLKTKYYDICNS